MSAFCGVFKIYDVGYDTRKNNKGKKGLLCGFWLLQ